MKEPGKITNWKEVGGDDLEIAPFQRNAESGSQVLMEKLVMDGQAMMEPPEGYMLSEMGTLMEAVRSYDNSASAIGYSVFYYASDMEMASAEQAAENWGTLAEEYSAKIAAAVATTDGMVATYEGAPIQAVLVVSTSGRISVLA